MLIYRIEDESGKGPYIGVWKDEATGQSDAALSCSHADAEHPVASIDIGEDFDKKHFCGCPSLEALEEWFDGWEEILFRNGYFIVKYDIPDDQVLMGYSGRQVGFVPDCTKTVVSKPIFSERMKDVSLSL